MNLTTLVAKTSLIGLTLTVPLFSFTSIAQASYCRAIAHDSDGSVAVRSQPRNNIFNLITSLPNGTRLDVIGRRGEWLKVYAPDNHWKMNFQTGWVAEKETRRACSRDDSSWYSNYDSPPRPPRPPRLPRLPRPPLSSPPSDWNDDYDY